MAGEISHFDVNAIREVTRIKVGIETLASLARKVDPEVADRMFSSIGDLAYHYSDVFADMQLSRTSVETGQTGVDQV